MDEILQFLKCPITKKLMWEPVLMSDNVTYEKEAIVEYVKVTRNGQKISPKGVSLDYQCYPNQSIKDLTEWVIRKLLQEGNMVLLESITTEKVREYYKRNEHAIVNYSTPANNNTPPPTVVQHQLTPYQQQQLVQQQQQLIQQQKHQPQQLVQQQQQKHQPQQQQQQQQQMTHYPYAHHYIGQQQQMVQDPYHSNSQQQRMVQHPYNHQQQPNSFVAPPFRFPTSSQPTTSFFENYSGFQPQARHSPPPPSGPARMIITQTSTVTTMNANVGGYVGQVQELVNQFQGGGVHHQSG